MVAFNGGVPSFRTVEHCSSAGREGHSVVADMDGTLLLGRSSFPYFALVAYDVGGPLRLLLLLLAAPLAGLLYYLASESAGIQVLIFATFAGARVEDIESSARAVLPKFYSEDLHPEAWRVFSACGRRCVLTANPRIMVEAFLKDYLGVHLVIATEIQTYRGRATGFVSPPGVLVGRNKAAAMRKHMPEAAPEIGLGDRESDYPFMSLCQVYKLISRLINKIIKLNGLIVTGRVRGATGAKVKSGPSPEGESAEARHVS